MTRATEAELLEAWRRARMRGVSFMRAMNVPALRAVLELGAALARTPHKRPVDLKMKAAGE
jgi:hypothetical protein